MSPNPHKTIRFDKAFRLLKKGKPLKDCSVKGILNLYSDGLWEEEVMIQNCFIEDFNTMTVRFNKQITIKDCHIKSASFNWAHFVGGLTIQNCLFDNYLDFEGGGHNNPGNLYLIEKNEFKDFVNFNDCWFTGDVAILNNNFNKGTNISSDEQWITMDGKLTVEDNVGQTDINSDCRNEI
ncbi:hypothetical protein ABIB40_004206 [Pedobacter sp. UYP30]|uniref:hypothetical protein n=1 Tax=Pedobacter sp. UYP30 TaxID=1756400 RepID=UPI003393945E